MAIVHTYGGLYPIVFFYMHSRNKRQAEDESGDIFENAQTICEVRYWSVSVHLVIVLGDSHGESEG